MAALKLRDDPSPWIGPNGKGPKIAAAALSAAAVDTFVEQRYPNRKGGIRHTVMRQVTQMAIGNLVKKAPVVAAGTPEGGEGHSHSRHRHHHHGSGGKGSKVHHSGAGRRRR